MASVVIRYDYHSEKDERMSLSFCIKSIIAGLYVSVKKISSLGLRLLRNTFHFPERATPMAKSVLKNVHRVSCLI